MASVRVRVWNIHLQSGFSRNVLGLSAARPLSLSPHGLGFLQNSGLGKYALVTWWRASESLEAEATRTVKGHSWTWLGMPSIPAFYWSSFPSLRSIGQAFHPCILLVKPSIPVFYWSSLPSLCPIGQTFHPYVPLVKPSIPTSYWSKQSQDPPIFKEVEQWTALLCGGCQGHEKGPPGMEDDVVSTFGRLICPSPCFEPRVYASWSLQLRLCPECPRPAEHLPRLSCRQLRLKCPNLDPAPKPASFSP